MIRFDGIYQCRLEGYYAYMRFYRDGTIISVYSTESPKKVNTWFQKDKILRGVGKGYFVLEKNHIKFTTRSKSGIIEYEGRFYGHTLLIEGYTHIQHRTFTREFNFIPIRPPRFICFGGPKVEKKFELALVRDMDEIELGKVYVIGPDLRDLEDREINPIGILIEIAGKDIPKELEPLFECRIKDYIENIGNIQYKNHRTDIWIVFSKTNYERGVDSLKKWGQLVINSFILEYEIIEKIQISFFTEEKKVNEWYEKALNVYKMRDKQLSYISDKEVDTFYGCTLCNHIVSTHFCIITPEYCGLCGAINWLNAKAGFELVPNGPFFSINPGKCKDTIKGEWEGINEKIKLKTLRGIDKIYLNTILSPFNHTSCNCIQALAFYIPEVDGIGIVDRNFRGPTVNGLPFSTMANSTVGGKQIEGFVGLAIEHLRSPKLFQYEGGWDRIVWIPTNIKYYIKDSIPIEILKRIATEIDVSTLSELKEYLISRNHPVVKDKNG